MKKIILLLSLTIILSNIAHAQKTDIWIVRHGEKDRTNLQDPNPELSNEGKKRAEDLKVFLTDVKFNGAFSTPFKRTHQILEPLVKQNKIKIVDYNSVDELVDDIKKNYQGKTVIIAGHSNTILETIEAFGIKRPVKNVAEEDFGYIFHVILSGDASSLKTGVYGSLSSQTSLKN